MTDIDRNYWTMVTIGILIIAAILINRWGKFRKISSAVGQFVESVNAIMAMQFVPESIITVNEYGKIVFSNRKVKKKLGWAKEELKGETMSKIIPAKYYQQFETFKENHSGEDDEISLSIEVQKRNSELFSAEITVCKYTEEERTYYVIIIRDITHRLRGEETRRELQQALDDVNSLCYTGESLLKAGSWRWDMSKDNVKYTEGFRVIFGLKLGEVVTATDLMRLVHFEDRPAVNEAMLDDNKKGYEVEYRVHQSNGTMDLVRCIGVRELSPNGKVLFIHGAVILLQKNVS